MREYSFYAMVVLLLLCIGCSSTPEPKEQGEQSGEKAEAQKRDNEPTEEQIAKVMHDFSGIAPEHAVAVWRASEKAEDARQEFLAFYLLPFEEKKKRLTLLDAAIRTHKEATGLLEPLCKTYPHNVLLEDTAAFVTQGLRALERQKSVLTEGSDNP